MVRSKTCKVSNTRNAETVTISEALQRRKRNGRFTGYCVACGEEVRAHAASKDGKSPAHFEHKPGTRAASNDDLCSLNYPHR